jgi:hypothetical protein
MRIGESFVAAVLIALLASSAPAQARNGMIRVSVNVPGTLAPVAGVQISLEPPRPTDSPSGLLDLPDNEAELLAYLERLAAARGNTSGANSASMRCPGPAASTRTAVLQAVTDADGNATIQNLLPGRYIVRAGREGFLGLLEPDSFTALAPSTASSSVVVESDKSASVSLLLNPASTVSGRVVDANNTPVVNACVVLGLVRTDTSGKIFVPGPRAFTDNKGEYQVLSVSPGEYAVRVLTQTPPAVTYLLVEDLDKGTLLSVQPGTNAVGIDFKLPNR